MARYWGYREYRPLQREAMLSALSDRDSVVVLPTGGGKSLCFQVPAAVRDGIAIVVSPLISLMKDQVDALESCGLPAACLNSSLVEYERREILQRIKRGELKLLYVAPERLVTRPFMDYLATIPISFIAVDEAHCISDWGHDFRPEYREIARLREAFPQLALHAYTATATGRVRRDIIAQLQLRDPEVLVGSFDRPNLVYRVELRTDLERQVRRVIDRHKGESGIVYCITRKQVDQLSAALGRAGCRARPYHAGLSDEDRRRGQDAFIKEEVEIIVATVAFGMGIDKSNVRYVIHGGIPKSLEHYQQESGRAGRDGAPAECVLLYSMADLYTWRHIFKSMEPDVREVASRMLSRMADYCTGTACRHRAIVEYFGQKLPGGACGACDICLGETAHIKDSKRLAEHIVRTVVDRGEKQRSQTIVEHLVDTATDLLAGHTQQAVRQWVEQLVGQEYLARDGAFGVLKVTPRGHALLAGKETARLSEPPRREKKRTTTATEGLSDTEKDLFEVLRAVRLGLAREKKAPPFVIFSDATLRDMARKKPTTRAEFMEVSGVGTKKCNDYGRIFNKAIAEFCHEHGASPPPALPVALSSERTAPKGRTASERAAFEMFADGRELGEVARRVGRTPEKALRLLEQYIVESGLSSPHPWVDDAAYARVRGVASEAGLARVSDITSMLEGEVDGVAVRICLACLRHT